MEFVSAHLAKRMVFYNIIDEDDVEYYRYSIQLFIEFVIAISMILILAAILSVFVETVSFLTAFLIIRRYSDGYHCKLSISCFILSVLCTLSVVIAVPYLNYNRAVYCIAILISVIFLLVVGNCNNPDANLTEEELSNLKNRSRIIVVLFSLTAFTLIGFHILDRINEYFAAGILYNGISVCFAKLKTGRR